MNGDVPLYRSRYPGYDVLKQADDWDDVTRELVMKRVHDIPPRRFFTREEAATLEAFFDTLLPQDDRPPELRIPLLRYLDARLHDGKSDGWRHETLPPDPELWRGIAGALDDEAHRVFDAPTYADLAPGDREEVARRVHDAAARDAQREPASADFSAEPLVLEAESWESPPADAPPLQSPLWDRFPLKWAFPFVLFELVTHYYAHPYAWNEIGFGGPKFPHIYPRTRRDNPDEAQEVRLGRPP